MRKAFLILGLALLSLSAMAKVELPAFFSDNMVLQQQTQAAIWGTATPGSKVTVSPSWTASRTVVTADVRSGKWMTRIATPKAGGPYDIVISDGESVKLSNVLIGEVWFCSGQSNMEMPFKGYRSQPNAASAEIIMTAKASTPIRMCTIEKCSSAKPVETVKTAGWQVNAPEAVSNTSATAYWFALKLQAALDVPVGLLITDWGGSSIETWMDEKTIRGGFESEFDLSYLGLDVNPEADKHKKPCLLFNGQVNPLIPFTFKGMLWYQGETNRGRCEQYVRLQAAYVKMMRELFQVPDAPFYFVQIAPYAYGAPEKWDIGYFYEAQQKSLDVIPNSGMAVTVDAGEYGTIHPNNKKVVGDRLAYLALSKTYDIKGMDPVAPTYKSMKTGEKDGRAYIDVSFNVGPDGLSPMGAEVSGFEIAGADKVFHPAKAILNGDNVSFKVWSDEVKAPVAVRYCFRNWGVGTVYNNYGIPAAPFRTDDWNL